MGRKRAGSVYPRCGCRQGRAGLRRGASCPQLGEEGHGSWFFSLDLPRALGGRRRRVRRGGYATRHAAEQALEQLQVPGGRVLTVAEWLVTWLDTRARLRESTRRGYAAHIDRYLIPHLGMVLLAELHVGHLENLFTALLKNQGMSAATARRVHSTLRSALNAAVRERLLPDNPARYLKLPRGRRPHAVVWTPRRVKQWQRTGVRPAVAVWTPAQTAAFLNAITGHRLHAAFHLIALRGLRRGEAAGLRWCDVDLEHQVAYISWQLQYIAGNLVLCPLKTEASRRVLALDATTVAILLLHRQAQAVPVLARYHGRLLAAAASAGTGLICGGADPERRNITNPLITALDGGTGLPRLDTSRLRATWLAETAELLGLATFMAAAGISCSQRLGDLIAGLEPAGEADAVRLLGAAGQP